MCMFLKSKDIHLNMMQRSKSGNLTGYQVIICSRSFLRFHQLSSSDLLSYFSPLGSLIHNHPLHCGHVPLISFHLQQSLSFMCCLTLTLLKNTVQLFCRMFLHVVCLKFPPDRVQVLHFPQETTEVSGPHTEPICCFHMQPRGLWQRSFTGSKSRK